MSSLEYRRHAGMASRAAWQGPNVRTRDDDEPVLQPCEDSNHPLWERRLTRARQVVQLQTVPEDYQQLLTAAAAIDRSYLSQYRGWQIVAEQVLLIAAGARPDMTAAELIAAWTAAADAAERG